MTRSTRIRNQTFTDEDVNVDELVRNDKNSSCRKSRFKHHFEVGTKDNRILSCNCQSSYCRKVRNWRWKYVSSCELWTLILNMFRDGKCLVRKRNITSWWHTFSQCMSCGDISWFAERAIQQIAQDVTCIIRKAVESKIYLNVQWVWTCQYPRNDRSCICTYDKKMNMQNIWMLYACFAFDVMRLCIEQHGRCALSTVQYLSCTHLIK